MAPKRTNHKCDHFKSGLMDLQRLITPCTIQYKTMEGIVMLRMKFELAFLFEGLVGNRIKA